MRIFLTCNPPKMTAQQKGHSVRRGRVHVYTKPEIKAAEHMIRTLLIPHRLVEPLQGPLFVHLQFLWPYHRREKAKVIAERFAVRHASKPDFDNSAKLIIDCLGREKFFNDDGQIAGALVHKWRSPIIGIYIHLTTMETTVEIPPGFCPNCWMRKLRAIPYAPGRECKICGHLEPLDFSMPEEDRPLSIFGTVDPEILDLG